MVAMAALLSFSVNAQLTDSFETYPDGPYFGGHWTNWDKSNIAAENIKVVSTKASQGTKSGYIGGNGQQDPILDVGMKTGGTWTLSFDIFIDSGKSGYFNAQHDLNQLGTDGNWAYEAFIGLDPTQQGFPQDPGTFHFVSGQADYPFSYQDNVWFNLALVHNLDNNTVRIYKNGIEVTFPGTLIPFGSNPAFQGKLNGFDFFSAATSMSMYIDNIKFYQGALGVSDVNKSDIAVYPTSASDVINISAGKAITEINVLSLDGKQVLHTTPKTAKTQLNVSSLPAGVYLVKIQVGQETLTKKVIVK